MSHPQKLKGVGRRVVTNIYDVIGHDVSGHERGIGLLAQRLRRQAIDLQRASARIRGMKPDADSSHIGVRRDAGTVEGQNVGCS